MIATDLAAWFDAGPMLTIVGAPCGLERLGTILAQGEDTLLKLDTQVPGEPYQGAAMAIRVESSTELGVVIVKHGNDVVISGDLQGLAVLGENVQRLASKPKALGGHIHVDYFPGHAYLRPGSAPTVIRAR